MKNGKKAKNRFVPVEKRQKKEQKMLANAKRGSWFGVNPATKVVQSSKKARLEKIRCKEAAMY